MEFLLAEGAFEKDYDLLLAAGNAYAKADAERFAEYFRKDLLSSQAILAGKGEKYRRGRAKQGLLRQALEFYRQAIELRGASSDLLCRMALCHLQLEENAEALQKLKQRDEQFPSFAAAADYFRVADKMYSAPNSSRSAPLMNCSNVIERFPEHPRFTCIAIPIDGDKPEKRIYTKRRLWRTSGRLTPLPINGNFLPRHSSPGGFPGRGCFPLMRRINRHAAESSVCAERQKTRHGNWP